MQAVYTEHQGILPPMVVAAGVSKLFILLYVTVLQIILFKLFYRQESCFHGANIVEQEAELHNRTDRSVPEWEKTIDFTGFDNETGTSDGHYIVPNYVHFIKFQSDTFSFVHMICILAAFKHQSPEKLFIHTDVHAFRGKYWEFLINTPGFKEVLVIKLMALPTEIFGHHLSAEWAAYHGGDVARLTVMKRYGGIYVDNDSYLVRRLDDLRKYEFVAAWKPGRSMMNQVVLAHKDSRLLQAWYDGYKEYKPELWYFNAGRQPANVLLEHPDWAHSVPELLGTYDMRIKIYNRYWPTWRYLYSAHLMTRWMTNFRGVQLPSPITEKDILKYNNTFREMILDVYDIPGAKKRGATSEAKDDDVF